MNPEYGNSISSTLHYYFVQHPKILHFQWDPPHTFASSLTFLTTSIITYLALTLFLRYTSLFPPFPPSVLKPVTAFHSLFLSLLSLVMAVGISLSSLSQMPYPKWILCFPKSTTPEGPTFFWAHVFYLSKIAEFLDTLLIILSGSYKRLTFLHVYHHASVLVMCYVWLNTSQSLFPVALVTNALVHVVMYGYYFLCAVGLRPKWKRVVTNFQIVQFVFSFVVSGFMLFYHFSGEGCAGIWGWCFNAVFNASLLALFLDFHVKNYAAAAAAARQKRET